MTLRDATERPETIAVGANVLAGVDLTAIVEKSRAHASAPRGWTQPFPDPCRAKRLHRFGRPEHSREGH